MSSKTLRKFESRSHFFLVPLVTNWGLHVPRLWQAKICYFKIAGSDHLTSKNEMLGIDERWPSTGIMN